MSSPTSLVSIIIPTYNRAHLIIETLDSVLAQTYQNWECIVVDDGSTDNTDGVMAEYVAKDSRLQYHSRPKDRLPGGNAARNHGFEVSKGEFIQWFDSDDLMLEKYLEKRMDIFTSKKSFDVVFCAFSYFDENGLQPRISNDIFKGNVLEDLIDKSITSSPLSYLIRKDILTGFRFDEKLKRAQDADFFLKVFSSSHNLKVAHLSEVLYYVRKHQKTISSQNLDDGARLNSRFIVDKRFLDYLIKTQRFEAADKYKISCLKQLRRLLENKNYNLVIRNILNLQYLSLQQKTHLLFCVFCQYLFGRGANQFEKINM